VTDCSKPICRLFRQHFLFAISVVITPGDRKSERGRRERRARYYNSGGYKSNNGMPQEKGIAFYRNPFFRQEKFYLFL
jgi:hypothetical protein